MNKSTDGFGGRVLDSVTPLFGGWVWRLCVCVRGRSGCECWKTFAYLLLLNFAYVYICVHMYLSTYLYVCVCIGVSMYIYVCILLSGVYSMYVYASPLFKVPCTWGRRPSGVHNITLLPWAILCGVWTPEVHSTFLEFTSRVRRESGLANQREDKAILKPIPRAMNI